MITTLDVLEAKAKQEIIPLVDKVKSLVVQNRAEYDVANALAKQARLVIDERAQELSPIKEANTKAWQATNAMWKKYVADPLDLVKELDRRAYRWLKNEEKRIADENEKARKEAEAKLNEEKLSIATKLEGIGLKEQAEAVLDAPLGPVPVQEQAAPAKADGTVNIENWQATVVDADAVPREFCSPDLQKLGRYAKLMKSKAQVPGVTFEDIGTVRRSRA